MCLGGACYDVYLNDVAYWRCVPSRVWKYTIGGYQVMKKWLSYRERALLGRDLRPEEARYVTEMTRRIAAILLLEPAFDANYERVKADAYAWPDSRNHSRPGDVDPEGVTPEAPNAPLLACLSRTSTQLRLGARDRRKEFCAFLGQS